MCEGNLYAWYCLIAIERVSPGYVLVREINPMIWYFSAFLWGFIAFASLFGEEERGDG